MEQIFEKFDADGSGALDLDEIRHLFHQNNVFLEKDVLRLIFGGDEFTL